MTKPTFTWDHDTRARLEHLVESGEAASARCIYCKKLLASEWDVRQVAARLIKNGKAMHTACERARDPMPAFAHFGEGLEWFRKRQDPELAGVGK